MIVFIIPLIIIRETIYIWILNGCLKIIYNINCWGDALTQVSDSRREWVKLAGVGVAGLAVGYGVGFLTAPERVREVETPVEGLPGVPDEPLKIGYIYFMTGTLGTYGTNAAAAIELAVEEINRNGGILGRTIELTSKDEADRERVLDNISKMVQDEGAEFVVGLDSSGDALKVIPLVEDELQIPFIVTHAATPKLTECAKRRFIFRISMYEEPIDIMAAQLVKELYEGDVTTVANIGPDYAYGYDSWAIFSGTLQDLMPDLEFLDPIYTPLFTTDYGTYIDQIKASGADLLFSSLWGGDAATFFKQAIAKGLFDSVKVYMNAMLGATDTLEAIGNDNVPDNVDVWGSGRYWFLYPPHDVYPLNRLFVENFRGKTGAYPPYVAATSYTAIYAIKKAIESAYVMKGSWPDVDEIISALEGLTVSGPMGPVYIRPEDHQGLYDVFWGRLRRGSPTYPIPILDELVVYPPGKVVPEPLTTMVSC